MKQRFRVLDVFRGMFALLVAVYHLKASGPIGQTDVLQHGNRFVDFFFVLSGFIIYYNYAGLIAGKPQRTFMLNRVIRLYPLHVFMLLLFLAFETCKFFLYPYGLFKNPAFGSNIHEFGNNNLISFITSFLLLQSFSITNMAWNYPSWSISAEMVTYAAFCILIVYINRFSLATRIFLFLLISAGSLYTSLELQGNLVLRETYNFSMFRSMYGFFLGCIAYELHVQCKNSLTPTIGTLLEVGCIVICLCAVAYVPLESTFLLPILFFCCVLTFSFESGLVSTLVNTHLLRRIGDLSYSIYMTHAIIAILFDILLLTILKVKSPVLLSIGVPVYLFIVFKISAFTNQLIEIDVRKWLQTYLKRTLAAPI